MSVKPTRSADIKTRYREFVVDWSVNSYDLQAQSEIVGKIGIEIHGLPKMLDTVCDSDGCLSLSEFLRPEVVDGMKFTVTFKTIG